MHYKKWETLHLILLFVDLFFILSNIMCMNREITQSSTSRFVQLSRFRTMYDVCDIHFHRYAIKEMTFVAVEINHFLWIQTLDTARLFWVFLLSSFEFTTSLLQYILSSSISLLSPVISRILKQQQNVWKRKVE